MLQAVTSPSLLVFTSLAFAVFFPLVLAVHWSLRDDGWRKAWLLLASYVFYAAWDWRFLGLILLSTAVDFVCGLRIERAEDPGRRRGWLLVSLAVNLGLLAFFKYANWFVDSAVQFAGLVGWSVSERSFAVVLPVGISFYTFQTLSYTIDVYRGRLEATRRPLDFALFVAFFPQLVAGPIVRAAEFLPQLGTPRRWARVDVRGCLVLFLVGYVQKRCLADNVAFHADAVFEAPGDYSAAALVLAVLLFSIQIYGDFAGYSNMAIACGGLLGYQLPLNFDFPYLSSSVIDFWRRWHVTLSSWLRDYLYVPLGGNRRGSVRTAANLGLVMLLGGAWHGAGANFVLWGLLHGVGLAVCFVWQRRRGTEDGGRGPFRRFAGTLLTFAWVTLLWIPFRAYTLDEAWLVLRGFLGVSPGSRALDGPLWLVPPALAVGYVSWFRLPVRRVVQDAPGWAFAVAFGAACGAALAFSHRGVDPFVYFQF